MECLRCGVCCSRHPAFVGPGEIRRIVSHLGINQDDWRESYAGSGPGYFHYTPVRQIGGACVFLTRNGDVYACAIQPVKPDCCARWEPATDKKECREGMERRAGSVGYRDSSSAM